MEDVRREPSVPGFHRRIGRPLREEARPVPLFPRHRRARARAAIASSRSPARAGTSHGAGCPTSRSLIPNLCNDMHDCSVATGDAWLKAHIAPLLRSPDAARRRRLRRLRRRDEAITGGGGRIEALALGPTVRRTRHRRATNHYGLLRTIEDAWGLPRLGYSPVRRRRSAASGRGRSWTAPRGIRPGMLASIARALERRDQALGHGARVAALAEPVALRLGWDRERIKALRAARRRSTTSARSACGPSCWANPARSRSTSWRRSAAIRPPARASCLPLRRFHDSLPYVLFHHERWDGNGYPAGLAAAASRSRPGILAIADAFDAMISPRALPQRPGARAALAEVEGRRGRAVRPCRRGALRRRLGRRLGHLARRRSFLTSGRQPPPATPSARPRSVRAALYTQSTAPTGEARVRADGEAPAARELEGCPDLELRRGRARSPRR